MEEVDSLEMKAIDTQLAQSREKLDALVQRLRGIDEQLEALSDERQQYRLVQDVCGALDQLSELGAAHLFWGERVSDEARDGHIHIVRGRVDVFEKKLGEIEDRRKEVLEEIDQAQENTEYLEDDLYEEEKKAELKKLEWVVEREVEDFPISQSIMPWSRGGEDDQRYRKALASTLLLSLLFGVLFPFIPMPVRESWEAIEVPDRLTRLIREEEPPPPPPPVQEQTKLAEKEPEKAADSPEPEKAPKQTAKPKPDMASKGILAFREKFSDLAESKPSARLGAQARIRKAGKAARGQTRRSLVATQASESSGGIDIGALSRDVGSGGEAEIEGVEITRATSAIGAGGGTDRPLSGGPGLARSDEEIQIVFDRHKGALYRLYNRELRRDPTLRGQMVLRIRIEPDGSVTLCELQSSDMKAPKLAAQVVGRVKTFDFGAKDDIPAITILYPIDFLPAT